jgi:predicted permease
VLKLYNALLRLFPKSFRTEYEGEMRRLFADRLGKTGGGIAAVLFCIETLFDVIPNAARVHLDILNQDLRYTARSLSRAPGFAFTAILVTALGVGATTAAFSIADHVLFRPLPFPDSERLVRLWQNQNGYGHTELSPANYRDWKTMSRSFDAMGAFGTQAVNLGGDGEPMRLEGLWVTSDVLPLLGVPPLVGRLLPSDDTVSTASDAVVLSYALWQGRFGGDERVVGRRILLDGTPYDIAGVMPETFRFPNRDTQLWLSKRFTDQDFEQRDNNYVYGIGRLKKTTSLAEVRSEMTLVAAQLEKAFPNENAHTGATVDRLRDSLSSEARMLPLALLGAAGCLLLIACTNLTNLLLARAMMRKKEIAVRASLGAGRERLIRQLMTESLLLALIGGAVGVIIAVSAVPLLARLVPNTLPISSVPQIDFRLLGFSLVLTALTGLAFGVAPALRAGEDQGAKGLQEGSRGAVGGRRERARSALVAAEVMGSVVLLVCCGLLLRALWRVQDVDPGFRTEGVLTLRTALPLPRYGVTATRVQFYTRVLSEVRALPGVASAGYASGLPMVMRGGIWGVAVEGEVQDPGALPPAASRFVTPGFLETMRIPLVRGRDISEADTFEAPAVAVVSESLVRRHWPGQDPIGRRFKFGPALERTIVGVVGDIKVRGLERPSEPQVYLSYQQVADDSIIGYTPKDLVVRTNGPVTGLLPALRAIVQRADPQQPISDIRPLEEIVGGETAPRRTQVSVLAAFAGVAFLLAAVGLHGVLSFAVASRTQEIGVRMALGAGSGEILKMVLRESLRMAALGLGLGLVVAFIAGRGLQSLLAGLSAADLPTFAAACGLAAVMTLIGSLVPAVRAVRVNPMTVMRTE